MQVLGGAMKKNTAARYDNRILYLCLAAIVLLVAIDFLVQGRTPQEESTLTVCPANYRGRSFEPCLVPCLA